MPPVCIESTDGRRGSFPLPHLLSYSASKFAAIDVLEGLRSELMRDGIIVTTVIPSLMRTGSPRNAFFKGQHRAESAGFSIGGSLPFGSMNAETAVQQIVAAYRRGDAAVVLSLPAKALVPPARPLSRLDRGPARSDQPMTARSRGPVECALSWETEYHPLGAVRPHRAQQPGGVAEQQNLCEGTKQRLALILLRLTEPYCP